MREIVAETLHHIVDPIVYDEAVSLIEEHRPLGRDVVIVSTSGAEVVGPIGEMLGADDVIATQLEIVDGKYTGTIEYYAYAEEKARAIHALADERGYDLEGSFAYSDSVTDVPMLEAVGHPHAVNPDKELRRIAADRGWPILVFTKPVTLGSRLPPARSALAALALGGVGAVGWVLVGQRRRRRRPGRSDLHVLRAPPNPGKVKACGPHGTGVQQREKNRKPARGPGTHAATYPSYRARATGIFPRQQLSVHAW